MKNHKLLWSAPFGASLLIATIPGPCTTFDDVTPPTVDAAVEDTSTGTCDPGLDLNFYSVPASDNCNALLNGLNSDGGCCAQASACHANTQCHTYLDCLDVCHAPDATVDAAVCIKACDENNDSTELLHDAASKLPLLLSCAREFEFPDACLGYLQ